MTLRWRHNGRDSVPNHQPHDCLLNCLFRCRSKKTSKLRATGFCAGNSPGTGEFPAQMTSYAEKCFHLMTSSWNPMDFIHFHYPILSINPMITSILLFLIHVYLMWCLYNFFLPWFSMNPLISYKFTRLCGIYSLIYLIYLIIWLLFINTHCHPTLKLEIKYQHTNTYISRKFTLLCTFMIRFKTSLPVSHYIETIKTIKLAFVFRMVCKIRYSKSCQGSVCWMLLM